jgi:hypothetical protein
MAEARLKICFKNGVNQKFDVSFKDSEKFLMALEQVTAESFILNGISIDPKEIESVWLHVFPELNERR